MKQIQELIQERKNRGFAMAKQERPKYKNGVWLVRSASNPRQQYRVSLELDGAKCNCEDFKERGIYGIKCKHYWSVEYTISQTELHSDGSITQTTITKRKTYPQNWKAYNEASVRQKELYLKMLNDLCNTIQEPARKEGAGRPSMPLRDMVFASGLKVYTTFSLRRYGSDMKEAQSKGYMKSVPEFSTVAYYMRNPELTPILKGLITLSALPLKTVEEKGSFSIDATGFSPALFSRWYDHKYKMVRGRKIFYKAHLLIGNTTHIVCGADITTEYVSDSVMLPELVQGVSREFTIPELDADKGYLSHNNLECLDKLGIVPYIPFKSNTVATTDTASVWGRLYNYFALNQSAFMEHYHQRSNVESAVFMIKSKFGDYTRSKTDTACVNEILLKILAHNICVLIQEMFELKIEVHF
jgi:transposase